MAAPGDAAYLMGIYTFEIDQEVFRHWLVLPPDADILGIGINHRGMIEVLLAGEGEVGTINQISPTFTEDYEAGTTSSDYGPLGKFVKHNRGTICVYAEEEPMPDQARPEWITTRG